MSKFQLVRSGQKYGGGMPTPWRSGSRSLTPPSAHSPLDHVTWLPVWLGNVVWTCAQEEVAVDFGRLMALSTILSFSVVILFSFQTSELHVHQENECIVSLFLFPFCLFLFLQKIITRITVNLVFEIFLLLLQKWPIPKHVDWVGNILHFYREQTFFTWMLNSKMGDSEYFPGAGVLWDTYPSHCIFNRWKQRYN